MTRIAIPLTLLLAFTSLHAQADPWEFAEPITVTTTHGEKIFHHLESAGRRNIAVSANTLAIAWEDDRDGTPRIYLARKSLNSPRFSNEIKISGAGEAYEPSLIALNNNRFALAWEEDARVHLRLVSPDGLGPVLALQKGDSAQASLAMHNNKLLLVYSQREGRFGRIYLQTIKIDGQSLRLKTNCAVDAEPLKDEQLYPTLVALTDRIIVAWEDRRPKHTIIMASQSDTQSPCAFLPPQRVNKRIGPRKPRPKNDNRPQYGTGTGVARVALATYGNGQVLATWADKRHFREGHDIYAAHLFEAKRQTKNQQPEKSALFGVNTRVQDSFGGVAQQWHPTATGDASGRLAVGWDDNRDGDANIMLSWWEGDGWSEDLAVPGADGSGEQNHPSITLDSKGNLHLAWVERDTVNGPSRLRYLFGRATKE
jgi:hypothetical protein